MPSHTIASGFYWVRSLDWGELFGIGLRKQTFMAFNPDRKIPRCNWLRFTFLPIHCNEIWYTAVAKQKITTLEILVHATWVKQCWIHCGFACIIKMGHAKSRPFDYWSVDDDMCMSPLCIWAFIPVRCSSLFLHEVHFYYQSQKNDRGERWQEMHSLRSHRAGEMPL